MVGTDVTALQEAITAFAVATNPLATLVMNAVVKQAIAGTEAEKLDASKLGANT